ncbi:hypothetical protein [Pseudothauera rhizosphaerae]|uniref:Uncharacterized protein n=1 Tax=Pseudothauera rhizosphaerae TaxID=2565932 RepID=A0A4S4AGU0_9RHOO|nr:hypothetical protein [Pseudothauera rhizosphaerae]THF58107.1 hypothetical protein E6O51_17350 [Pseudothauera rhizosphaerae]
MQVDSSSDVKPPSISMAEIFLIVSYFLAIWLVPTNWLDTAFGEVAFDVASKINPYLSEYSIAFSANPRYFIHCHVLATWIFPPLLPYLIVKRNGGRSRYADYWRQRNENFGGWLPHLMIAVPLYGLAYFGMLWMVEYPLTRGEWAVWVGGVAPSALMLTGAIGIGVMHAYMVVFSAFSRRGVQR